MHASPTVTAALIEQALAGDRAAVRVILSTSAPVVQARAARILIRSGMVVGRDGRQDVEDAVQDVYVRLFDDNGKLLKQWQPDRGLSFKGFVGLVAEQTVIARLRSRRKNPWTDDPTLDAEPAPRPDTTEPALEERLWARDELAKLLDLLRMELSPRGLDLFHRLLVHQQPIESVAADTGMTANALYAWRSRLRTVVRRLANQLSGAVPGGSP